MITELVIWCKSDPMALLFVAAIVVLLAILLLFFFTHTPRIDITAFPRKFPDEKVKDETISIVHELL